ncbi:hypothetical protein Vqi01_23880 [Micromonospora qiuiae]|uniref:RNA polymerase sigma-70 region 2 domain-containing protein n=1 Tax=Micromonospora qiuiae TaxID=502268 RepID=A0ABQ4JAM7_9ACTN|nr:hypothetical protein Vqi01_23880 [Micromonospora qiuiae]
MQTALARAWEAWRRIDGDPEPYVRRVIVNAYASWWRRRWRGELPTAELPESGTVAVPIPTSGGYGLAIGERIPFDRYPLPSRPAGTLTPLSQAPLPADCTEALCQKRRHRPIGSGRPEAPGSTGAELAEPEVDRDGLPDARVAAPTGRRCRDHHR